MKTLDKIKAKIADGGTLTMREVGSVIVALHRSEEGNERLREEFARIDWEGLNELDNLRDENKQYLFERDEAEKECDKLDDKLKRLRELLEQCLIVFESDDLQGALTMSMIHGAPYAGPEIDLDEIKKALGPKVA